MTGRHAWWVALAMSAACHSGKARPSPAVSPALESSRTTTAPDLAPASVPPDTARISQTRVASEALRLFGDSTRTAPADSAGRGTGSAPRGTAPAAEEPTWDIDVHSYETHARVEYHVRRFTSEARDRFAAWLARGGRYEPMIRAKLRAAGLPEDMTYLALIESGYDPHAYSRAAAVGMWQIMTTTARGTGLRVDWWVDERRDPVRSTDAAIKFLGWLNEQFGSLYLAAAAYNGGPGRVARGLSRYADDLEGTTGDDAFFALAEKDYLRAETRDYVPKLIAAAIVAKEPERYGLKVSYLPPFAYDTVRVGPSTPLAAVAKAARVPMSAISDLNSHVLRGVTPPRDSFVVRLPVGAAAGFRDSLLALPEAERTAYTRVTSKKGDTRASLARRGGVSVGQLLWYNPKLEVAKKTGRVPAGQTVLLPRAFVVAAARDVPDPSVEIYGSARRGRVTTHVVRRGESLGLIAKRYHTSVAELMRLNRLRKSVIIPGQEILVRRAASVRRTRGAVPRAGASSGRASGRQVHVVRRGETLGSIAKRYNTTVADLRQLNRMSGSALQAGQRLIVGG